MGKEDRDRSIFEGRRSCRESAKGDVRARVDGRLRRVAEGRVELTMAAMRRKVLDYVIY